MNKLIKCRFCDKTAVKNRLCRRHFNKSVRDYIKMIDETRKADKGYQRQMFRESRNMGY